MSPNSATWLQLASCSMRCSPRPLAVALFPATQRLPPETFTACLREDSWPFNSSGHERLTAEDRPLAVSSTRCKRARTTALPTINVRLAKRSTALADSPTRARIHWALADGYAHNGRGGDDATSAVAGKPSLMAALASVQRICAPLLPYAQFCPGFAAVI